MKITLIIGGAIIILLTVMYFLVEPTAENIATEDDNIELNQETRLANPDTSEEANSEQPAEKLKADTFTGKLESINTGCYADGECYAMVDGKHVTTIIGWSRGVVGSVELADGFGGLESHIDSDVEVYAQDNGGGTYTLYGSKDFYIKLVN